MIISASYKTDIPAFYGEWFMARLEAGFCRMVNPYGRQVHEIRMDRGSVTGVVFWTRNLGPFRHHLTAVAERGYPFVVHYSITGYPGPLERSVIGAGRAITDMRWAAGAFGPRAAVWRYDPVVESSLTPIEWHAGNFASLARRLEGATDEVVISFAHIYRKTRRNMGAAARAAGFTWRDPDDGGKRALAAQLAEIAGRHGMTLTICAQPALTPPGIAPAKCIDAERLGDVAGAPIAARTRGNRPGCLCAESRDIGDYDTCPHGCVFCYAVSDPARARDRFRAHDPATAGLFAT